MQEKQVVVAWLFQKYDGRPFYAASIIIGLNSLKFSMMGIYLQKRSDLPNLLAESGCRVEYLSLKGEGKMFNPMLVLKLAKCLKTNKVDILHCHRHMATLYGALAGRVAKVPVVFSHVHGLNRTRNAIRRIENRILLGNVNKTIAVSDAVRKDILASNPGMLPEKVITLHNSVDLKKFAEVEITGKQAREKLGLPVDAFIFGTVGRLAPTKGQTYLIEAFAEIRRVLPLAHLVLVGKGNLENELKQQAARLGCFDAVTFCGYRKYIPRVLRAFNCFVFPSIAEGLPGALLEAMAAGLPCIAAAVGGIPEIIADGRTGLLVPPKDKSALADAMLKIARHSANELQQMCDNARQRIACSFSNDVVIKKLETIYESGLSENS